MTVLFLYTEIADYFLKCCEELSNSATVHIIRWPVNKEAPFKFNFSEKIKVYDKHSYNYEELEQLVRTINPQIIVCSGWIDKDYLKIVKSYFKKIPTVLSCDTHWRGDLKQQFARVLSRFFLLNRFSHGWVPGEIQKKYLLKLGFKINKISTGFYCCDLDRFNNIYEKTKAYKNNAFPKVFLYVGRYYEFKGITDLWNAFIQLQQEDPNDWELWCLGNGSVEPIVHPKIKHYGFVQPTDLFDIIQKSGVFVLPSRFEPWGVVVQEYAAAGFPMIVSDVVGANEAFVHPTKNGYTFKAQQTNELKEQLKKIVKIDSKELNLMGANSHHLAQKINKQIWAQTIIQFYHDYNTN